MNSLVVVGMGYIGLPTAALFASVGVDVVGVDVNPSIVDAVNEGKVSIAEPGLASLLSDAVASGRLRAQATPTSADGFVIAVPTPFKDNMEPDMGFVDAAIDALAPHLAPGNLVVLESTCPVGATQQMAARLAALRPDLHVAESTDVEVSDSVLVAYCPERVLPGNILYELRTNDRIAGGLTPSAAAAAAALYDTAITGVTTQTSAAVAELAKLAENSFRDVNIAFANELAVVASELGVPSHEVIRLANRHPRVNILSPGPGVGGHCIAVDPWFIVHSMPAMTPLIRTARAVNDAKPAWVADKIAERVDTASHGIIACLGLAYKPNVDDLRESPAIDVVRELKARGFSRVVVVEPHVQDLPDVLGPLDVELMTLDDAIAQADVFVGLVAHDAFASVPEQVGDKRCLDVAQQWTASNVEHL